MTIPTDGNPFGEKRTRYILEAGARKVKGRLLRDVLATDPDGRESVAVEAPNGVAVDVLEALRRAYQQGREDNAQDDPAPLARGILQIADAAGMPDTFWCHDSRVRMARDVLGVPVDGRYTHAHLWEAPESASREIES
jgi:hypothetical protein